MSVRLGSLIILLKSSLFLLSSYLLVLITKNMKIFSNNCILLFVSLIYKFLTHIFWCFNIKCMDNLRLSSPSELLLFVLLFFWSPLFALFIWPLQFYFVSVCVVYSLPWFCLTYLCIRFNFSFCRQYSWVFLF